MENSHVASYPTGKTPVVAEGGDAVLVEAQGSFDVLDRTASVMETDGLEKAQHPCDVVELKTWVIQLDDLT